MKVHIYPVEDGYTFDVEGEARDKRKLPKSPFKTPAEAQKAWRELISVMQSARFVLDKEKPDLSDEQQPFG